MSNLQITKLVGVVADVGIADGPPLLSKVIASGANGTVYGTDQVPAICELTALGGDCVVTWTVTGASETIPQGGSVTRRFRGEALSVA